MILLVIGLLFFNLLGELALDNCPAINHIRVLIVLWIYFNKYFS